ncbi:hypothetical protein KEM60_01894 [Austwickia sp. TVS 96-490-7B]|nr:hypothetical protein [Austwickia sp. TVS 96-490-7B]
MRTIYAMTCGDDAVKATYALGADTLVRPGGWHDRIHIHIPEPIRGTTPGPGSTPRRAGYL